MVPNRDPEPSLPGKTVPGPAPALVSGGDLPPGYVVGEYRVEQVIGRGGMGVVYAGLQPLIEKRVAIKVLNSELSADPSLVRRFIDEARAVNRIRHPNIVDIFSFGQLADSRQYFVMEYLEGRALADRLKARDLPLTAVPPLLGQICDALDAAHAESIVHRDLKPENVWIVEPRRGRPFVKLLDFGIAKLLATGDQTTTQAGVLMGTPQYMSPEQCHGRAIDARTDIYAMGVLLYELFTGQPPFRGEGFAEILTKQLTEMPERPGSVASVPAALDDLIMRCLAKDQAARPQTARELGEALARIFNARPTEIDHAVEPLVPGRGRARSPALAAKPGMLPAHPSRRWKIVLLVVALGAAGAWAAVRLAGRPSPVPPSTVAAPVAPPVEQPSLAPTPAPVPSHAASGPSGGSAPAGAATEQALSHAAARPSAARVAGPPARGKAGKRDPAGPTRADRSRASSGGLVTDNPFR